MNKRSSGLALLGLFAFTLIALTPSKADAQPFRRWFGNSNTTQLQCANGQCEIVRTNYAPVRNVTVTKRTPYEGYTSNYASESCTGGVGAYQSNGSSGGYGSYGIQLAPGERLVSVSAPSTVSKKQLQSLTALEDGSLLDTILKNLEKDPDWEPTDQDDPLLHAAFGFFQNLTTRIESGAIDTAKFNRKSEPKAEVETDWGVTWKAPEKDTAIAASFRWKASPPTTVAMR